MGRFRLAMTAAAAAAAVVAVTGCTAAVGGSGEMTPGSGGSPTPTTGMDVTPSSAAAASVATPTTTTPVDERVVPLAPGVADEASGIAAARATPGSYFLIDDGRDDVIAVDASGRLLATVTVDGMTLVDPEALVSGTCGPMPPPGGSSTADCLYIGDIGDNLSGRDDVVVVRMAEPALTPAPDGPVPADEWRYTYPDGAQNAEGMMIEPDGSVVIVTKPDNRNVPTRLYRGEPGGGQLRLVREFTPPRPAFPLRTAITGNVVVDVASQPGRVLLLTYDELHEYTAPSQVAELTTFPDWPHRRLALPALPQPEGVAGEPDGCGYVVASEAGPGGANGSLAFLAC